MSAYSLEARIIQKKDQLEELSVTGAIIPAPIVEEVRTGQQFLIKLHILRNGNAGPSGHMPTRFPSLRVGRRVAINTAGEPRTEPEPLTLEIGVHLAKSGQVRKGACAKCCHKVLIHAVSLICSIATQSSPFYSRTIITMHTHTSYMSAHGNSSADPLSLFHLSLSLSLSLFHLSPVYPCCPWK
jgi:hypothetical protein